MAHNNSFNALQEFTGRYILAIPYIYLETKMKNLKFLTILCAASVLSACGGSSDAEAKPAWNDNGNSSVQKQNLSRTQTTTVDASEQEGLLLMREEEKLARDVYLTLYSVQGLAIFQNISNSEQSHMDAVKGLLDRYGIPDPVTNDVLGVFANTELQSLYDYLVASGSASLLDALYVGATIEELDIADLEQLISEVDGNSDIVSVYENLLRGSRNHLRSFHKQILNYNGYFEPSYITQEHYDEIVNSPMETGR